MCLDVLVRRIIIMNNMIIDSVGKDGESKRIRGRRETIF